MGGGIGWKRHSNANQWKWTCELDSNIKKFPNLD